MLASFFTYKIIYTVGFVVCRINIDFSFRLFESFYLFFDFEFVAANQLVAGINNIFYVALVPVEFNDSDWLKRAVQIDDVIHF